MVRHWKIVEAPAGESKVVTGNISAIHRCVDRGSAISRCRNCQSVECCRRGRGRRHSKGESLNTDNVKAAVISHKCGGNGGRRTSWIIEYQFCLPAPCPGIWRKRKRLARTLG